MMWPMDINLLVVNVGNTRVGLGVFAAGELVWTERLALTDADGLKKALTRVFEGHLKGSEGAAVAGASVNARGRVVVDAAVLEATGFDVEWVGEQLDVPMPVKTLEPAKTGVDRVLNLAAAYEVLGKGCVVVDAGTAVTVDCCSNEGTFLGGAIAPGVHMQIRALSAGTDALPEVEMAVPVGGYGADTAAAIRHGIYHGIRGLVQHMTESFAEELGVWPEIIATGGDADVLFAGWELIHSISPDLTLHGIAKAYADHHIRHG
jgi:type III pantothenate kinase